MVTPIIVDALKRASYYVSVVLKEIEKGADRLVVIPIIIYTLFFSAYTCFMHYNFKTYAWDLGIITQSLWTTLNSGKILYSTLEVSYGNPTGNFLGVHFSPILFLILPIYALFQSPQTLLALQSFILAVAALPLYWIARDKLGNKLYGLAFASVYLLNPALHGVNTFDFHLEIFTPVLILFAFYYLEKGKWINAVPFLVLELSTLEFAPFIVFSLGLYFFLKKVAGGYAARQSNLTIVKKLVVPVTIMVASVCSFYLALYSIASVNPMKSGGTYHQWEYWGENVFEALTNIIRNPAEVAKVMFTPNEKSYFALFLFSSVLFLPMLAPLELLMTLPWLLAALLTDYQPYYQPYYQYSVFALGQIFIAAVYGFQRLFSLKHQTNNTRDAQKKIIVMMLVLNVFVFAAISPVGIPAFTSRSIRSYAINTEAELNHVNELHKVLNLIPPDASVATINDIFPHLCQRLHAYFLKWPLDYEVDYILVDLKSPAATWNWDDPTPVEIAIKLEESNKYGILASLDGILLLERNYAGPIRYYSPQVDVFNYRQLIPLSGKTRWDYTSTSKRVIISDPKNSLDPCVWYGPYKYFVKGKYSATFRIKTSNETGQLLLDVATEPPGSAALVQRIVNGTEFNQANNWQDFSIYFTIEKPARLEFRGICISSNTQFAVDFVRVEQLEP